MALGEKRNINQISQVSWTDWTAQDVYYWLDHSFQYSANINTDDEMHWIKLSTRAVHTNSYAKCQLVSLWEHWVMAVPMWWGVWEDVDLKRFQFNRYYRNPQANNPSVWTAWPLPLDWEWDPQSQWTEFDDQAWSLHASVYKAVPWVVFQDRFWYWANSNVETNGYIFNIPCKNRTGYHWVDDEVKYKPRDHNEYTDEDIETPAVNTPQMSWGITALLNYNNTRLVVAAWQDIWVYYPELDLSNPSNPKYDAQNPVDPWLTWWKRVLRYEPWVTIVALTCTFEYLKVWAVDEWWNTKVYYYQGNNNLRSTFVYNLVDLTWVRVLHVYSINWIDYYTSSIAEYASDALVDFNKMVWATPVKLFSQRAGMTVYDVNNKAPYFVWPTSISWAYNDGHIYVADAYGVFSFKYTPNGYDKGYMKWRLRESIVAWQQVYWLCENKWILYVSDSTGCWAMRLYDTWMDGYQPSWILISREFEGKEWGTITKMLDEIRLNFELNPLTDGNGEIFVFVSPNNQWRDTNPSWDWDTWDYWYHVMTITQDSAWTRTEKSNLVNTLWRDGNSSFSFDWQTITYAIVITRWDEERATPIVRQIDLKYHSKDKVNNVYNIN